MKRKEDFINDKRRVSYLSTIYNRIYRGQIFRHSLLILSTQKNKRGLFSYCTILKCRQERVFLFLSIILILQDIFTLIAMGLQFKFKNDTPVSTYIYCP